MATFFAIEILEFRYIKDGTGLHLEFVPKTVQHRSSSFSAFDRNDLRIPQYGRLAYKFWSFIRL